MMTENSVAEGLDRKKRTQQRIIAAVSLLVTVFVCAVIYYFAFVVNPDRPVSEVLCPINYTLSDEGCEVGKQRYDSKRLEVLPAVQLAQNEAAIYQPPGDNPARLVEGIGYHEIPQKYSFIYPTNIRTIKTERDFTNPGKCTEEQQRFGECNSPLDNVRLQGAVEATIDYEIDIELLVSNATAGVLLELGGYPQLVSRLTSYVRSAFRDATAIDPALYETGNISDELRDYYLPVLEAWEYADVIQIRALRIRSVSLDNDDISTSALSFMQQERAAEAYATQMAVICQNIESDVACAQHMAVFQWEQNGADGMPPLLGTPAP